MPEVKDCLVSQGLCPPRALLPIEPAPRRCCPLSVVSYCAPSPGFAFGLSCAWGACVRPPPERLSVAAFFSG